MIWSYFFDVDIFCFFFLFRTDKINVMCYSLYFLTFCSFCLIVSSRRCSFFLTLIVFVHFSFICLETKHRFWVFWFHSISTSYYIQNFNLWSFGLLEIYKNNNNKKNTNRNYFYYTFNIMKHNTRKMYKEWDREYYVDTRYFNNRNIN